MTPGTQNLREKIGELIDQYWDLAYSEGKDERVHDDDVGSAGKIRKEIDALITTIAQDGREPDATVISGETSNGRQMIAVPLDLACLPNGTKLFIHPQPDANYADARALIEDQKEIIAASRARIAELEGALLTRTNQLSEAWKALAVGQSHLAATLKEIGIYSPNRTVTDAAHKWLDDAIASAQEGSGS